jgi:CO dehydrogenase/acetyl-CoA synthase alpha subunit
MSFVIDIAKILDGDDETKNTFNQVMHNYHDEQRKYIENLAKNLNVSVICAEMINYLRKQRRWSQELENNLIRMNKDQPTFDWYSVLSGEEKEEINKYTGEY